MTGDGSGSCGRCGVSASALGDDKRMLRCGGCRAVFYCSAACQKADWKRHKKECGALAPSPRPEARAAAGEREADFDVVQWGGPALSCELLPDRLARVLAATHDRSRYDDRLAKARELFRLGALCFFERLWCDCALALAEAYLLDEAAAPRSLIGARLSEGPQSVTFGQFVRTLRSETPPAGAGANWHLRLALLEARWLDMQMLLTRELCDRSQEDPEAATVHQQRWFDLLLEMDNLARKALARWGDEASADRRILSRLTLQQAQYGGNPPLSRGEAECQRLAAKAVELWPEDVEARCWCGRPDDLRRLLGTGAAGAPALMEPDARRRGLLAERLRILEDGPACMAARESMDEDFKISGGDYVIVDGDHTEKSYDEVVAILNKRDAE